MLQKTTSGVADPVDCSEGQAAPPDAASGDLNLASTSHVWRGKPKERGNLLVGKYNTCMVDGVSSSYDRVFPYHSEA